MSSSSALSRSSPESEGVDPAGIQVFLDTLESAPDIEMHSLMIIRHGQVVAEGWWSPYAPEQTHLLYSLSKSFTSTAAAFAVAEGLLDLDATVLSYFPELDREITDPRSRSMLVRHVAAMASGHLEETADRALVLDPLEPVRGFLLIPPDREPGSVFAYNQPCTYSLAAIVQRLTGQTLTAYCGPGCSIRWASDESAGSSTPLVETSGTQGSTRRRTRSPGSVCCTCRAVSGTVSGCFRRNGSLRPPESRLRPRTSRIRIGVGGTDSSFGCRDTDIAATARTGNSAWCFPNRMR